MSIQKLSFFSDHFYPIFYLIAPLYFLKATPVWLFLVHGAFFGAMAYPILALARRYFGHIGLWLTFVYLLAYYPLRAGFTQDLHGEIPMMALMSWVLYFLELKRDRDALITTGLLFFTKETAGVLVVMIGAYWALIKKEWRIGLTLMVVSVLFSAVMVGVFIPAFGNGETYRYVDRYSAIGGGFGAIINNAIFHPLIMARQLFSVQSIGYVVGLLLPFGFLPLVSPYLLIGLGLFFQNVLTDASTQISNIASHYSLTLIPILFIGFITTLHRLRLQKPVVFGRWKRILFPLASFCIALNVLLFVFMEMRVFWIDIARMQALESAKAMIPDTASVSASERLFPQIQYRQALALFPDTNNVTYILVEGPDPTFPMDKDAGAHVSALWAEGAYLPAIAALIKGEQLPHRSDHPDIRKLAELNANPDVTLLYHHHNIRLYRLSTSEQ